jgi:hypothetical protein
MKELLIPRSVPSSARSANCTGKADFAVYGFVMRPIGFTHGDLRLDFCKFACKIRNLARPSAGNRVIGGVSIVSSAAGLGPTPAATGKPFIPVVVLFEENSRLWLKQIGHLSRIANTACVPRHLEQKEGAE